MNAISSRPRGSQSHRALGSDLARRNGRAATRMPAVILRSHSDLVRAEVERIASLAGVQLEHAATSESLEGVLSLSEVDAAVPTVEASFHPAFAPYFAAGSLTLALPDEAEDLLELLLAAGSTQRGVVLGVVGSHGGAGATTLAAWLARSFSEEHTTALLDLDSLSAGIDRPLGLSDSAGLRWGDLGEDLGSFVPGRLNAVLPALGSLRVLSADQRGGVPRQGGIGERAIAALSQVNSICVLDLPRTVADPTSHERGWLEWCDAVVLVGAPTSRGLLQIRQSMQNLPPSKKVILVGNGVSGGAEAASLAQELGAANVMPMRRLRNLNQDLEHGVRIGDRNRCATARDVTRIGQHCMEIL